MTAFKSLFWKNHVLNVVKFSSLVSSILLIPFSIYEALTGGDTFSCALYAFFLINVLFGIGVCGKLYPSNRFNITMLIFIIGLGTLAFYQVDIFWFIGIVGVSIVFSYFYKKETSIKETLLEDNLTITDNDFIYSYPQLYANRDNYYFLLKICYYKSKLDWLDRVLQFTYKYNFDSYREYNSLLFQFILWADFNAYEVLKKNFFFVNEEGGVVPDDIVDLIHYYNYEEKYDTLSQICKDVYKVDKDIYQKMNTSSFQDTENMILERLKLDSSLKESSNKKNKIIKI